jgi:hypothetical protein
MVLFGEMSVHQESVKFRRNTILRSCQVQFPFWYPTSWPHSSRDTENDEFIERSTYHGGAGESVFLNLAKDIVVATWIWEVDCIMCKVRIDALNSLVIMKGFSSCELVQSKWSGNRQTGCQVAGCHHVMTSTKCTIQYIASVNCFSFSERVIIADHHHTTTKKEMLTMARASSFCKSR